MTIINPKLFGVNILLQIFVLSCVFIDEIEVASLKGRTSSSHGPFSSTATSNWSYYNLSTKEESSTRKTPEQISTTFPSSAVDNLMTENTNTSNHLTHTFKPTILQTTTIFDNENESSISTEENSQKIILQNVTQEYKIKAQTSVIALDNPPPLNSSSHEDQYIGNKKLKRLSSRVNAIKNLKEEDKLKLSKSKLQKTNHSHTESNSFLSSQKSLEKSLEIVSLKTKPQKFHAMLKTAQESDNFEDPFSMSSHLHNDSVNKLNSSYSTDSNGYKTTMRSFDRTTPTQSSDNLIRDNIDMSSTMRTSLNFSATETTETPPASAHQSLAIDQEEDKTETPTSEMPLKMDKQTVTQDTLSSLQTPNKMVNVKSISTKPTTLMSLIQEKTTTTILDNNIKEEKLVQKKNVSNSINNSDEDSQKERKSILPQEKHITINQNHEEDYVKKLVPVYDEISRPLHVDSSIDDIEGDEPKNPKLTENLDIFLPKINSSYANLLDPDLYQHNENTNDIIGHKSISTTDSHTETTLTTPPFLIENNLTTAQHLPSTEPNNIHSSPSGISALLSRNNSRSNFVKDHDDLSIRQHATNEAEVYESVKVLGNQTNREASPNHKDSFGFNGNWNMHTKGKETDPNLIRQHNERVLEVQADKMLQVMNKSANPCEDFYEYACGKWADVYPLKDKALDNTFDRLREGLDEVLKSLLEEPISDLDTNASRAAKILYKGCMDEDKIEELGTSPLKKLLKDLGGWPVLEGKSWNESQFDWVELMAVLRTYNNDILLSEWVAADITNSSYHIIQLDQPELGLPGREYFISSGDEVYRMAYMDLMLKSCELLGGLPAHCFLEMLDVLQFEQQLARILTPAEERRNLSAVHQRLTVRELEKEIPQINWRNYLKIVLGHNRTDQVIVFAMKYIKKMVDFIDNSNKRTVSNYLLWRFVKNRISNLGQKALNAKQEFLRVLFGSKSQPDRWMSCVSYVNGNLGYAVGSLFVKKYYPKSSKNDSEVMIHLIRESFIEAIRNATWMTKSTRKVAEEKVKAMVRNVGYPEYILDDDYMNKVFSQLKFNASEHFWNVIQMLQYHAQTTHHLLDIPVNRTEWTTTPAVVNAYYSRSKNMILFPAGILQPPFYHPAFPRSLNFGGIGVVIGHEISHGFDDRGRQFDGTGNLKQWWTEEDVSQFYGRATCMLDQYGEYKVEFVGLKINAVNTLGENIADNAGLKIAYKAYQRWKKQNGGETTKLPKVNLTYDQLFFLNFGQIWCEVNSPEAMLTKIRGGQHSPNKYRVIGTLSNSEEFNAAFNCPKGLKMNPENKCKVW